MKQIPREAAEDAAAVRPRSLIAWVVVVLLLVVAGPALVWSVWAGASGPVASGTAYTGAGQLTGHPLLLFRAYWAQCWFYAFAGAVVGFLVGAGGWSAYEWTSRRDRRWDWAMFVLFGSVGAFVAAVTYTMLMATVWIQYPP